jgi:hypothetical protein
MGRLAPNDEICVECEDFWRRQQLPPKKLVMLGSTQNKKIAVLICPYCDGERAISLSESEDK